MEFASTEGAAALYDAQVGAPVAPKLRLEFIGKKLLIGDWIGTAVGLSWLLLGGLALAFNDARLRAYARRVDADHPASVDTITFSEV